jgi:hypothetical protein
MLGAVQEGEKRGCQKTQNWALDTYSGTTCLICGFTYPSTALAAKGKKW